MVPAVRSVAGTMPGCAVTLRSGTVGPPGCLAAVALDLQLKPVSTPRAWVRLGSTPPRGSPSSAGSTTRVHARAPLSPAGESLPAVELACVGLGGGLVAAGQQRGGDRRDTKPPARPPGRRGPGNVRYASGTPCEATGVADAAIMLAVHRALIPGSCHLGDVPDQDSTGSGLNVLVSIGRFQRDLQPDSPGHGPAGRPGGRQHLRPAPAARPARRHRPDPARVPRRHRRRHRPPRR